MLIIEARKDNHWTINFQEILVIILRSVGKFYPQNLWITLWIYLLQSFKSQVLQTSVTLYKKATLFYILFIFHIVIKQYYCNLVKLLAIFIINFPYVSRLWVIFYTFYYCFAKHSILRSKVY